MPCTQYIKDIEATWHNLDTLACQALMDVFTWSHPFQVFQVSTLHSWVGCTQMIYILLNFTLWNTKWKQ